MVLTHSTHENIRLTALKEDLKLLLDYELRSAKIQSRMTWASLGNANTKFFHLVASARKNQNSIWGLQDDRGILIEDDKGLKALGVRYFSNIFKDDGLTNIELQLKVIQLFPSFLHQQEDGFKVF